MELVLCPRCDGQAYDLDGCDVCNALGVLDGDEQALTTANVRELLSWLKAWQVNFSGHVTPGEPVVPSRYWPADGPYETQPPAESRM